MLNLSNLKKYLRWHWPNQSQQWIRAKCSKLTKKTQEWDPRMDQWPRSCVFIVSFEHILQLFLMFTLLTLSTQMLSKIITVHLEQCQLWWKLLEIIWKMVIYTFETQNPQNILKNAFIVYLICRHCRFVNLQKVISFTEIG